MIDDLIISHVTAKVAEVFTGIDEDSWIVRIGSSNADKGPVWNQRNNAGKFAIYQETIQVQVIVSSEARVDREAFARAFKPRKLKLNGYDVFCEWVGMRQVQNVAVIGTFDSVFMINFTWTIFEN